MVQIPWATIMSPHATRNALLASTARGYEVSRMRPLGRGCREGTVALDEPDDETSSQFFNRDRSERTGLI
jgi:hypothetical protein